MRISSKCSVAIHLLLVMAVFSDMKFTSERLAMSTGCNSVVVRNTLGKLKKAGLITIVRGTGGAYLTKKPEDITVWTVFQAVDSLDDFIGVHKSPAEICPVGEIIHELLEKPYALIARSVQETMQSYTLQQLVDEYHEKRQGTIPNGYIPDYGISRIHP